PYSLCQGPALVWDNELSTPPARDRPPSRRHPRGGALRGRLRVLALRRPADGDPGDLRPARHGGEGHKSEEHTSELQSRFDLVCRLLLETKNSNLFVHVEGLIRV